MRKDPSDKYHTCYEEPGKQVLILYGTEYGFSEEIARKLFDRISDNQELVEVRYINNQNVSHSKNYEYLV